MEENSIRLITTSDGSHSLYNPQLKETYHSTHGALTESLHVFIKEGLELLVQEGCKQISILEVGFGTGLNALLVWDFALKHSDVQIHYETLEPFPLDQQLYQLLNYTTLFESHVSAEQFQSLHTAAWAEPQSLNENFTFVKHKTSLKDFRSEYKFNLVFYDAFAPSKQAEMWDVEALGCTYSMMDEKAVLVTYCAQGQFKRNLAGLGLQVETRDGPPGKKEMVRARK